MGGRDSDAALALIAVPSCTSFKDQLLDPQNPGLIDETAWPRRPRGGTQSGRASDAWKQLYTSSETLWQEAGHVADEFANADFQPDRNDVDQRTMSTATPYSNYSSITGARRLHSRRHRRRADV
jgi:hypothetical protein